MVQVTPLTALAIVDASAARAKIKAALKDSTHPAAAKALGVSLSTLWRLVRKLGIQ